MDLVGAQNWCRAGASVGVGPLAKRWSEEELRARRSAPSSALEVEQKVNHRQKKFNRSRVLSRLLARPGLAIEESATSDRSGQRIVGCAAVQELGS
ncbi:hypothetical protein RP20_CCG015023 [Aedes albopictus]|nr:hypothetical protein RP20_CCG015023 [Aedes albopictus]